MALVGDLVVNLGLNSRKFQSGLGSARGMVRGFSSSLTSSLGSVVGFGAGLAGTAAAALGVGSAIGALTDGFQRALNMEQLEVSFGVLFKNVAHGKAVLSELATFANATPFEMPELADAAGTLAGFGTAAGDIIPDLRMLGDIAAGLNQPIGELAYLYGSTRVEGRLMAKDLNQFLARGIPLIQGLAAHFGIAESEVRDLVSTGAVGFDDVRAALVAMTSEGGQFFQMTQQQSQTTAGMLSTLKDAVGTSLREISETFLNSFDFKGLIARATDWARQFGEIVTFAIRNAGDLWELGITNMTLGLVTFADSTATTLIATWTGVSAAFDAMASNILTGLGPIGAGVAAMASGIADAIAAAFRGENPLEAFRTGFEQTLDALLRKTDKTDPLEEFRKNFDKSMQSGGFFDDMETGLQEDRDRILNNIAGRELKFTEQQQAEAAAAAGLEQSTPGDTTGGSASKAQNKIAGGAERGSKEAFERILKAGQRGKDPQLKVQQQSLAEQKKQTAALQAFAKNPPAVAIGTI